MTDKDITAETETVYATIDRRAQAVYVHLDDAAMVATTRELSDAVNGDYDKAGNLVGIEILGIQIPAETAIRTVGAEGGEPHHDETAHETVESLRRRIAKLDQQAAQAQYESQQLRLRLRDLQANEVPAAVAVDRQPPAIDQTLAAAVPERSCTGTNWCPNCRTEAGTNRYVDGGTERCATCGFPLAHVEHATLTLLTKETDR